MDLGQKKTLESALILEQIIVDMILLEVQKKKKLERALIVDMILLGQKSLKVH